MNESGADIERETIYIFSNQSATSIKTLEMNFTLSGSTFKTQLPVSSRKAHRKNKVESGLEQLLQRNICNESFEMFQISEHM